MRKRRLIKYKIDENGCWICTSHKWKNNKGYPHIERNKRTTTMAKYLYEIKNGKIPKGLIIRHKCDNPECINGLLKDCENCKKIIIKQAKKEERIRIWDLFEGIRHNNLDSGDVVHKFRNKLEKIKNE